ncbi:hypothetical protein ID866_8250, partial [Astraeus odoratus]
MVEAQTTNRDHQLAQKTLQANKDHQRALNAYIANLEDELHTVEKLIDAVDTEQEEEAELDVPGFIFVPGAVRATSVIPSTDLLSPDSPFFDDAAQRNRYKSLTDIHPMKARELEALAEAVRTENYRKMALEAQLRGFPTFADIGQQSPRNLELNKDDLDWDRIAEKVSRISMTTRTAKECEIRWLGDRHPEFQHAAWSDEEITKLKSLVHECGDAQPDWVDIAHKLGTNRTPLDCMRQARPRKLHSWTSKSDARLIKAVIARYVSEDAAPTQCSSRYQRVLDPSVKRTNWTPEEDARLRTAIAAYGRSWVDVAAAMPGRTNDQCRDRWNDHLNPTINRSPWDPDEDQALLDVCRSRYLTLQRSPKFTSAQFPVVHQHILDARVTSSVEPSSVGTSTPSSSQPRSLSPLPTSAPLEECHFRTECSPLMFLEPVVDSDPTLAGPHQGVATTSAKPLKPPRFSSHTLERSSTPASSISSSSRRGKKRQKQTEEASDTGTTEGSQKRRRITRPKRAGMDGQLFITFCSTPTTDSAVSTPNVTTPSGDSQGSDQISLHVDQ